MGELALRTGAAVLGALIVAAVLAVVRKGRKKMRRRNPVGIEVQRIVREPWSVAFSGSASPDMSRHEGKGVPPRDVYDMFSEHGAVDYSETKAKVTVRNSGEEPIAVRDIRISRELTLPYAGTRVFCDTAGANSATLLVFELESDDPEAREWMEDGDSVLVSPVPYFDSHHVSIDPGRLHEFVIVGRADSRLVRWSLLVSIQSAHELVTKKVDDGGVPFVTSGRPAAGFLSELDWAWWEGGRLIPLGSATEDVV